MLISNIAVTVAPSALEQCGFTATKEIQRGKKTHTFTNAISVYDPYLEKEIQVVLHLVCAVADLPRWGFVDTYINKRGQLELHFRPVFKNFFDDGVAWCDGGLPALMRIRTHNEQPDDTVRFGY